MANFLKETPWDSKIFGIPTYEIKQYSQEALDGIKNLNGHFTIKVDPLADKRLLIANGFYYSDTLLEPFCKKENFKPHPNGQVRIEKGGPFSVIREMCLNNAFAHGRFHKDPFLPDDLADLRYASWLEQLHSQGKAFALMYGEEPAGFFCVDGNQIPLHAVSEKFRGKGLAKYFWSAAIERIFASGFNEAGSSVSASNLPVINLYISLGFTYKKAVEVYHKNQETREED